MPVDQIEQTTQLVVSNGFLGVLGGLMVLFLAGLFATVLWAGRAMLRQQAAQQQALFTAQSGLLDTLVKHVLHGNGDPDVPGLRQIGQRVGSLEGRLDTIETQQVEFGEYVVARFEDGTRRFDQIDGTLSRLQPAGTQASEPEGVTQDATARSDR